MSSMFNGIYSLFWGILKIPLITVLCSVIVFACLVLAHVFILRSKGVKRVQKVVNGSYKKRCVLLRLLYDFPKQLAYDYMYSNPNDFPYRGIVIFTGRQGNGKTIALVNEILKMKKQFPLSKVITNLDVVGQDCELVHWKQLMTYNNGKQGVICAIDETQNWFSSSQSKNFPPQMLEVVTQNRKNHRIILGTAQNFYLLAKAIRSQCTEIRSCFTILGCLTVVRRQIPIVDNEGNVQELKRKGYYFFVHNNELRNAYDTYRVIESLSNSGFQEKDKLYV